MPLLGTVVGRNPDGITRWLRKKVDQWKEVLLLLERKEMPAQLSVLLARWIMIAKPNSLLRSIFPDYTAPILKELDEAVIRCLEKRLSLPLVDIPRQVLQLRIKDGGVGFSPAAETAPHAYVAGMAGAIAGLFSRSNLIKQHQIDETFLVVTKHKAFWGNFT